MKDKHVTYFEATAGAMLVQVNCISREQYVDCLTFLEEKYPDLEVIYREWSDGTVEDGVIERGEWYV